MRHTILCLALASLLLAGCGQSGGGTVSSGGSAAGANNASQNGKSDTGSGKSGNAKTTGTNGNAGNTAGGSGNDAGDFKSFALSPENTLIQFVGTHVGDKPDPRTCNFQKFSGTAEYDAAALKSIAVEIETDSLATFHPDLTKHLNSPDFFDTREHPKSVFKSTSINSPDADGKVTITGELTLLKTTKEISFPATVTIDDEGPKLKAEFTIDRTEFGMDRLQDRVEKGVGMTVIIGQKTELPK
jgi:polyisoprenoid-binding protein YceI